MNDTVGRPREMSCGYHMCRVPIPCQGEQSGTSENGCASSHLIEGQSMQPLTGLEGRF